MANPKTTKADTAEDTAAEATEVAVVHPTSAPYSIDPEDIDIPWINVIQKTSNIDADLGAIVLDKKHTLAAAEQIVAAIPLEPRKGWKEDIDFDSDEVARVAYTEEERAKLEEESDYDLLEFSEIPLLIPAPDGKAVDEAVYMFPVGDKRYAVGRIYAQKDGFRMTHKRLKTFDLFNHQKGVRHTERVWDFQSELMEKGKYRWYVPSLRPTEVKTDPELLAFLREFGS